MMTRFPSGAWAFVLIASILLNGVVLGIVAAGAYAGMRLSNRLDMALAPPPSMRMIEGRLPPEDRREMLESLRREARASRPLMLAAREANKAAMETLSAEDFDIEASRAAFAEARKAREALERRAHEAAITLFSNLPPETRKELVRMRRDDPFGGGGRGGYGGPGRSGGPRGEGPPGAPGRGMPPPDDGFIPLSPED